jgi:putative membrane-bound dehydrogenase-like protein
MILRNFSPLPLGLAALVGVALVGSRAPQSRPAALPPSAIKVPEGYVVEVAAGPDLVDYPMFATTDETGRLFVFESTGHVYKKTKDALDHPQFRIKLLTDTDGDGRYDRSTIFADRVGFPQGGVFYKGCLYASSAPDLLKLTDTNGDGVADRREVLLTGWTLNVNANSLVGPFWGPDGWLYLTNAIMGFDLTTKEGQHLKGKTGRVWRVRPDGSNLQWISAGGMNNPVELTFTEAGEPIGTETYFTDPVAGQRDALVYWTEGGVYPKPSNRIAGDSLVRTGELMPVVTKYSRVAPSGIGRYRHTAFGADFKDNLFSAQFNTHRVLRHKLIRDGGSFRTVDEVFFSAENEDFHPTDVLEDADGSLLVVETGGWFIEGCPLSQVSKPELKGSIYRVRKKGAPKAADPTGNRIAWASLTPAQAVGYLTDARPTVRDRAQERLVDLGAAAVGPLTGVLKRSPQAEARTRAVFALYRIGTPEALASVRLGLSDRDLAVQVAAARAAGLARDAGALSRLQAMVTNDQPAAQRQAATALGQLGDVRAIPTLLAAAEKAEDRFVRHALIFSLITLNQPQPVAQALGHRSANVREAALVALDQMKASTLRVGQVTPLLNGSSKSLQRTALWVASLHPEWADDLAAVLRERFNGPPLSADEEGLYGEMLTSFGRSAGVQRFMVEQLQRGLPAQKLFLLGAMGRFAGEKLPESWLPSIGRELVATADPRVQARALELVSLRNLTTLTEPLNQVADEPRNAPGLRIQAIGALLKTVPTPSEPHFAYLVEQLQPANAAPLRQQAATVLAGAKLSEAQLLNLAQTVLPKADAFTLPRLVPVFAGAHDAAIGQSLAAALSNSPSLDGFSEENLKAVFARYPASVQPAVDELLGKLRRAQGERLARLNAMEATIAQGDLERGRRLFFGKAICSTCHKIGGEGGKLGPDLTSIQRDRSAHDLLEAIVYPSVSFVREYETYRVKTKTGEYLGTIQEQSPTVVVLGTGPQTSVRIPRSEVVSMELHATSMMPQGLDQLLTKQELADLLAFLLAQDQDPKTDQAILR